MTGNPQLMCPPTGQQVAIDMYDLRVLDPDGIPSNLIIDVNDDFQLEAAFHIGGTLAQCFAAGGVEWTLTYYYEGFGTAPEGEFDTVSGTSADGVYDPAGCGGSGVIRFDEAVTRITVSQGENPTLPPGNYKLSAMVVFTPQCPLTGAYEGPMLTISSLDDTEND